MRYGFYAGDTDKTIYLRLRDSTTGLAKTGLAYNSAGAVCSYTLPLAARAAITLATQTVTGAHSDGGFVEIDATNCKGLYRLDLPDAAIASGAFTVISIEFDGIIEESVEIELFLPKANVTQISDDATAADNAELMFDGTGYAGGTARLKVDLDTIKTQAITCAAGVTILASVGTAATSTAQTGDSYALANGANGFVALKSDTAAILVDTGTTLDGRIPAALGANGNMKADIRDIDASAQSMTDLKDFADTGYNPVTHYIAGIEGALNQFDDLNNAVTAPTAAQNRAEMDTNSTQLAAIVLDTGTTLDGKIDTIDGIVDSILVDTGTTLDGRLPAALTAGGNMKSDMLAINGVTAAALRQALAAGQLIPFTVDTGAPHTPTTTEFQADDITEATADHYNGRSIVWLTGALTGQATSISDYAKVGSNGQFTVVAMTEAPANDDTGIIV